MKGDEGCKCWGGIGVQSGDWGGATRRWRGTSCSCTARRRATAASTSPMLPQATAASRPSAPADPSSPPAPVPRQPVPGPVLQQNLARRLPPPIRNRRAWSRPASRTRTQQLCKVGYPHPNNTMPNLNTLRVKSHQSYCPLLTTHSRPAPAQRSSSCHRQRQLLAEPQI
jgi:hypothetical protein